MYCFILLPSPNLYLDGDIFELIRFLLLCRGVPPSPRSDHAAAVHAERYLLIFGGGSHATCFNDLHVLDLQAVR
jgi:hypothetical protein